MKLEGLLVKEKFNKKKKNNNNNKGRGPPFSSFVHPPKSGCLLVHKGGLLLLCARAARMPISFFLPHSLSLSRARKSGVVVVVLAARTARLQQSSSQGRWKEGRKEPTYLPTYLPLSHIPTSYPAVFCFKGNFCL
jgi:hypothetical protein